MSMKTNFNFTVMENASGTVCVTIGCVAVRDFGNGSITYAGIEMTVKFLIDPNLLCLKVRVLDQWGWPVTDIGISLWKGTLEYVRQPTNDSGRTTFLLSKGLYTLRAFEGDMLLQKATLNIMADRLFEFTVYQGIKIQSTVPIIPVVEISIGFFAGYVFRLWEKHKDKNRDTPKSEFEDLLEWCREQIS